MGKTIKTKVDFEKLIEETCNEFGVWQLANNILYDLCKKHPSHVNPDEVIAKVWLIGRSYAAALERGRNTKESSDLFYEKTLIDAVAKHSNKIDESIKLLSDNPKNVADKNVFDAYMEVLEWFHKASEMWNVSLASKYLHFHCPNIFFLYDSRAASSIGKIAKFLGAKNAYKEREVNCFISCEDEEERERMRVYVKFYLKCKECSLKIKEAFGKKLSIRDFDNLLLRIANEEISLNENVIE